ncbi:MAG: hypothetical protein IPP96_17015 [Chitinophagaceae bacterium]|nr:hypothetical protein [Chitinophagaceae bacterium]
MTEEQVEISLNTKKLKLSFWNKVTHFGIVGFLIFIPASFAFLHFKDALNDKSKVITTKDLLIVLIPLGIALLFYILQSNRLKFQEVDTNLSKQQLKDIIEKVANQLGWFPKEVNDNYIVAITHPSLWSGSWGEQITILFTKNKILINSICDPGRASSITSMGRNRKHVNKLIEEIKNASR